ncbi:hypothetical protein [Archaeoglobus profundus]|uniref:Uncharacterized protein n=1 Tax=Archaeoglobus profundus (strain DSM 5631 / JCM 9629 / NBRC 100127 / Av18) TaxID=572546 RepID=D2RHZ0_ARCPA|nr:hypothetical protein [Archaeoglobus profundus]ADB57915.1 hypothetical protein Arcpr_0852 [Archaeoglobus profundus DSM 5631]
MRMTFIIFISVLVLLLLFFGITSWEELVKVTVQSVIIALVVRGVIKIAD